MRLVWEYLGCGCGGFLCKILNFYGEMVRRMRGEGEMGQSREENR